MKLSFLNLILPAAALSMSVFGLAAGSSAHSTDRSARNLPLDCEIAVSRDRNGHTYEGRVHAAKAVKGSYELNITKRGGGGSSVISQSGDFNVAAGKSETLGSASFGGSPTSAVTAELTVYWNGTKLSCSNHTDL